MADNLRPRVAPACHAKSNTALERRHRGATYLAIITTHIRIRDHLRDRRAQRVEAVLGLAVVRVVERLAERDGEVRALLGRGEREELGDLEPCEARRARVARKDGAVRDRRDLLDCILEQLLTRGGRGQWVRLVIVKLHGTASVTQPNLVETRRMGPYRRDRLGIRQPIRIDFMLR